MLEPFFFMFFVGGLLAIMGVAGATVDPYGASVVGDLGLVFMSLALVAGFIVWLVERRVERARRW